MGSVWVPGELLFFTREEAESHLQEASGDTDGDERNDEGEGVTTRGRGLTRGGDNQGEEGDEEGGDKGGEKEGDTEGEKGGAGGKDAPRQPSAHIRGSLRTATCKRGAGGWGANRANKANGANPAPSDPAPARNVTVQMTYGGGGATGLGGGWGG